MKTFNRYLFILMLIINQGVISFAQINEPGPPTPFEKKQSKKPYNIAQFFHESFLFIKQPLVWDKRDWINVGIMTGATLALMPFDQQWRDATQGEQRYYHSFPVEAGRMYGEWYSIGAITLGFGLYGWVAKDTAARKISIELLQAGIFAETITGILKVSLGRARPRSGENAFTYHPFSLFDDNFHSLPSGHTTSAFAISTIMSRHAKSTFLKIAAYLPAGLTMFSRIYQNNHWLSDEIIAGVTGYFVGHWVVDLHEGKRHKINVVAFNPYPVFNICLNKDPAKKKFVKLI